MTTNTITARPSVVRDSWNVLVRELRPVVRDPFSLIFSLLQPLVFLGLFGPLLILSGMLLPLEDGPQWMQVAASLNPITYVVSAEHALFAGDLASIEVVWGYLAAIVLAAIGLVVGIRSIKRSN